MAWMKSGSSRPWWGNFVEKIGAPSIALKYPGLLPESSHGFLAVRSMPAGKDLPHFVAASSIIVLSNYMRPIDNHHSRIYISVISIKHYRQV